jgi:hypothetical protein
MQNAMGRLPRIIMGKRHTAAQMPAAPALIGESYGHVVNPSDSIKQADPQENWWMQRGGCCIRCRPR